MWFELSYMLQHIFPLTRFPYGRLPGFFCSIHPRDGIGTYFFHISMMIKRMLKNLVVWHCPLRVPFESFDLKRFQLHWNVVVFQKKRKYYELVCAIACIIHSFHIKYVWLAWIETETNKYGFGFYCVPWLFRMKIMDFIAKDRRHRLSTWSECLNFIRNFKSSYETFCYAVILTWFYV